MKAAVSAASRSPSPSCCTAAQHPTPSTGTVGGAQPGGAQPGGAGLVFSGIPPSTLRPLMCIACRNCHVSPTTPPPPRLPPTSNVVSPGPATERQPLSRIAPLGLGGALTAHGGKKKKSPCVNLIRPPRVSDRESLRLWTHVPAP